MKTHHRNHFRGRGWLEVQTHQKRLRWQPTQEWYDLWGNQQAQDELLRFFDHFLQGKPNGWESTPKVPMAVWRFGEKSPEANVVEQEFLLARTDYKRLYLTSESRLSIQIPDTAASLSYESTSTASSITFNHTFTDPTRLVGLPKAVLYMSCADLDDMDVYILLRKLDESGQPVFNLNIPWSDNLPVNTIADIPEKERTEVILYAGPAGILRASHRAIDESRSMHPHWPFLPHEREDRVTPGTVVRLDIGIWAMGIEDEAGESLQVEISGHIMGVNNFGTNKHSLNKGRHVVHFGGEHASHVILPFV
ncbi:galactose-binding domain-like protein [Elsinoe ampelina]|uniref:Galactose-binding domain-like protein n=1 Tax=Elsinoe ampelina TaxID=302913 RepID=A0A6A6GKN9_9PEZI|nr:galactose-binding domain-like protein [Elsinoe ampelina]